MQIVIIQLLPDLKKIQWDLKCIMEYIKLDMWWIEAHQKIKEWSILNIRVFINLWE